MVLHIYIKLLSQTRYAEIAEHVEKEYLNVYLYHGPNREKDIKKLAQYDVIITNYAVLTHEYVNETKGSISTHQTYHTGRKVSRTNEYETESGEERTRAPTVKKTQSTLLKMQWFRVV